MKRKKRDENRERERASEDGGVKKGEKGRRERERNGREE